MCLFSPFCTVLCLWGWRVRSIITIHQREQTFYIFHKEELDERCRKTFFFGQGVVKLKSIKALVVGLNCVGNIHLSLLKNLQSRAIFQLLLLLCILYITKRKSLINYGRCRHNVTLLVKRTVIFALNYLPTTNFFLTFSRILV